MASVKNYLSLVKFSHTIFALPFALIGFILSITRSNFYNGHLTFFNGNVGANTSQIISKFLLVLVCMVSARSAAMAFNRWLDKKFDARNPRTAIREIPMGIILSNHALRFVLFNCAVFILTTWFINKICFFLSPVALFVILFYSYTKRFTPLCHLVLGLGLSLAPIGAFLAVTGRFEILPLLFSFTVLFWVSGFDIIYALQDVEFDQSQNLYSIPAVLGKVKAIRLSRVLHAISAIIVTTAGVIGKFGFFYWTGIAVFIGMLFYQHSIVNSNDLRRVNLAFMTANGIASVVFAVFVITDLFFQHRGFL